MIFLPKLIHKTLLCFRKPTEDHHLRISVFVVSLAINMNFELQTLSVVDSPFISLACLIISFLLSSSFRNSEDTVRWIHLTIRRFLRPFVLFFSCSSFVADFPWASCFLCFFVLSLFFYLWFSAVVLPYPSFEPFSSAYLSVVWPFLIVLHFSLLILVILLNKRNYVSVPPLFLLPRFSNFTDAKRFPGSSG